MTFFYRAALPREEAPNKVFLSPGKKGVSRGNISYTPDFLAKCPEGWGESWIEVKGYLDKDSRIKLKRFKRYYPKEFAKLHLVVGSHRSKAAVFAIEELGMSFERLIFYKQLSKRLKGVIKEWE